MTNLTAATLDYRNAIVYLWNKYFQRAVRRRLVESPELGDFEIIDARLFRSLVLRKTRFSDFAISGDAAIPFLQLIPTGPAAFTHISEERRPLENTIWKEVGPAHPDLIDVSISYVGIFDWDRYGVRTGELIRGRVANANGSVYRDVLLNLSEIRVHEVGDP